MNSVIVLDNYDSFTYNLVQYFQILGARVEVFRNNEVSVAGVEKLRPQRLVISPGPGVPDDAGVSLDVVRTFASRIPIFGVCLGMQIIAQEFGCRIRKTEPMHGKTSSVIHDGRGVFAGLPNPIEGMRYHSLVVSKENCQTNKLEVSAEALGGVVMGLRHHLWPIEGVQFHPESVLTERGIDLLENFLKL